MDALPKQEALSLDSEYCCSVAYGRRRLVVAAPLEPRCTSDCLEYVVQRLVARDWNAGRLPVCAHMAKPLSALPMLEGTGVPASVVVSQGRRFGRHTLRDLIHPL
jgi:hypothetical protein